MKLLSLLLSLAALSPGMQGQNGPVLIFIGPPGSGKSVQAAAAAKTFNLPLVTSDQLIKDNRQALSNTRTPGITGMEPETDPMLNDFFGQRVKQMDTSKGMVLDGYPITKDQCDFVAKLALRGDIPRPVVVRLNVPDKTALKRMKKENTKSMTSVDQRLKDYHREMDLIQYYFPNATILEIDATKKLNKVTQAVNSALRAELAKVNK